jgi:hypothetical protein
MELSLSPSYLAATIPNRIAANGQLVSLRNSGTAFLGLFLFIKRELFSGFSGGFELIGWWTLQSAWKYCPFNPVTGEPQTVSA